MTSQFLKTVAGTLWFKTTGKLIKTNYRVKNLLTLSHDFQSVPSKLENLDEAPIFCSLH